MAWKKIVLALLAFPVVCVAGTLDVRQETIDGQGVRTVNDNFRRLDREKMSKDDVKKLLTTPEVISVIRSSVAPCALIVDKKAQGTSGGVNQVGAGDIRTLNTVVYSDIDGLELIGSTVTLPSGTYYISWSAPFYRTDRAKSWLSEYVNGVPTIICSGSSEFSYSAAAGSVVQSLGHCVVETTDPIILGIRYRTATAASNGLGVEANVPGIEEIYTQVEISKIR